jgi:hypothetical protein
MFSICVIFWCNSFLISRRRLSRICSSFSAVRLESWSIQRWIFAQSSIGRHRCGAGDVQVLDLVPIHLDAKRVRQELAQEARRSRNRRGDRRLRDCSRWGRPDLGFRLPCSDQPEDGRGR